MRMENNLSDLQRENVYNINKREGIVNIKLKRAVKLLLEDNMNITDIAKTVDLKIESLYNYFENINMLKFIYGEKAEEIKNQIQAKLFGSKKYSNSLRIDIFSKDPNIQNKYLMLIALTFRIKTDTVEKLFGVNPRTIFKSAYASYNLIVIDALKYLDASEDRDQKEAVQELTTFYKEYVQALRNKDLDKIKLLKRKLNDYEAYELMKKPREIGDKMSDEEIGIMINYRLKYYLSNDQIAELFKVNRKNMIERMYKYLEDKEELRERFANISKEYNQMHINKKYSNGGRK